jgi:hypothetical protein
VKSVVEIAVSAGNGVQRGEMAARAQTAVDHCDLAKRVMIRGAHRAAKQEASEVA